MIDPVSTAVLPPLVVPFLLTLAISFLIGIGLRDYYESAGKFDTFGTVRTLVFIGMLGFMLYTLPEVGNWAFLLGMVTVVSFLLVYYGDKVQHKKSPGLIGVSIAQLTYAIGPVAIHQPHWFLVLIAISILFVLHSKGRVRRLTDRLETGEIVTVCKFLAIAAVILPMIPETLPPVDGIVGALLAALPVTPRQIWLAVVITTTISYLGYVLQTYLFPRKGLLLTGLIGGVYSSTAAVLVLAKRSRAHPGRDREAAAAILLAVSMMYLRILVLVAIFRIQSTLQVGPALLVLSALAATYALWIVRPRAVTDAAIPSGAGEVHLADAVPEPALRNNPLELNSAFLFALLFVIISIATKYTLLQFHDHGLRVLSFVVGFSDITPFVVSVLQGDLGLGTAQILQAIVIASASNNLMKLIYAYVFGTRRTANLAAIGMGPLALISFVYAAIAL
jgi:uncharacterized membrane protein (DUF4010 family)